MAVVLALVVVVVFVVVVVVVVFAPSRRVKGRLQLEPQHGVDRGQPEAAHGFVLQIGRHRDAETALGHKTEVARDPFQAAAVPNQRDAVMVRLNREAVGGAGRAPRARLGAAGKRSARAET